MYKRQVQQLSGPSFGCLVKAQPVDEREAIFGLIYDMNVACLLYTSDAADERSSVDLGGRRIIKKKKKEAKVSRLM